MDGKRKVLVYKTEPPSIETVQKRGLGHPDALCDALAERISAAYARYCFEQFGVLIHYSIDGLSMAEGESRVEFGGGEMIKPIRLYLRGYFSAQFMDRKIPYLDIAKKVIYDYLNMVVPGLNAEKWVRVVDGTQIYGGPRGKYDLNNLVANHIYTVSAMYANSPAENCALRIEQKLNSPIYKQFRPGVSSDNKIVVIQNGNSADIAAYVSLISKHIHDADEMRAYIEGIKEDIRGAASTDRVRVDDIEVYSSVNPLHDGRALTVTGSSIESFNGCAVARSRYPVYHAAKIYAAVAHQISKRITNEENEVALVSLTSKVGWPISAPWHTDINLLSRKGNGIVPPAQSKRIEEIINDELGKTEETVNALMYGKA